MSAYSVSALRLGKMQFAGLRGTLSTLSGVTACAAGVSWEGTTGRGKWVTASVRTSRRSFPIVSTVRAPLPVVTPHLSFSVKVT
jgi:hypothetical protein